jgi:MFS family permease
MRFYRFLQRFLASNPAFRSRNYRLLWLGLLISFSGSLMQNATVLWHVSTLVPDNQKGLALGLVGLVRIFPIILFSLWGGVLADAVDRRRLMLITQSVMTLLAALLAFLTFSGILREGLIWPIYLITAFSAAAGAFDNPARQSLIPNLVPREHLPNAISLNSIMHQTASVIGPTIGGLIIARLGIGWVYAYNAASFLAVIGAVLAMNNVPPRVVENKPPEVSLRAAWEGLRFVFTAPLIRSTMLLDFFATFFASAKALLPIYAQDILKVGAEGYGLLSAAEGAGAMMTSFAMAEAIKHIQRRGQAMLVAVAIYGVVTVIFGLSPWFWLSWLCLFLSGAADMVSTVIRNVVRQLSTPDHLRGRMTSVSMIFFMGGPQLGELEAGLVAQAFGPVFSVISGGLACLAVTGYVAAATPQLRDYAREPIEVAGAH